MVASGPETDTEAGEPGHPGSIAVVPFNGVRPRLLRASKVAGSTPARTANVSNDVSEGSEAE